MTWPVRVLCSRKRITDHAAFRRRDDFAEVEIECQDDPVFDKPLLEDVTVREAVQPFVSQMDRIVAG